MSLRHASVRSLISSISLVLATAALGGCLFENPPFEDIGKDFGDDSTDESGEESGEEEEAPDADDCPGIEDGSAYLDGCSTCIERQANLDILYITAEPLVFAGNCVRISLDEGYLVEEIYAMTKNFPGETSSSWVHLYGPDGTEVGSLNIHPQDLGVDSGTAVLDPPVHAVEMALCSEWNSSIFITAELRGDEDACTPSY